VKLLRHVAWSGEKRNACRGFVGKPEGKRPSGKGRHKSSSSSSSSSQLLVGPGFLKKLCPFISVEGNFLCDVTPGRSVRF
jgi:hypothetical protein